MPEMPVYDQIAMRLCWPPRLRYHLHFKWDAQAVYHWPQSDASEDLNHGALFSIGRHVRDHLKLAVGYNCTRFDDSLLNEDADVHGGF